jgi:ribokinase
MSRVIVVGSMNVDLVVTASHLPRPGETVTGGEFSRHFGGKGANQAVAAARAGAAVAMIGAVGEDANGHDSVEALRAEGIDVSGVRRLDAPTGVAIIAVGPNGENQIVVASGANALLAADDVASSPASAEDVILGCLEIPMPAVIRAVLAATQDHGLAIVNPAPAQPLSAELLAAGPILTPNAEELLVMTGEANLEAGVAQLINAGAQAVIVTLGVNGALLAEGGRRRMLPGRSVTAHDTTGAGDTFSGVLAAWLASGADLDRAAEAANCAAALSVTQAGARGGMPSRAAIEEELQR